MDKPQTAKLIPRPQRLSRTASYSAHFESALFFDTIPPEILDNVLRFVSLLPHAVNWEKHVPLWYIARLYCMDGGFGTLLRNRFHTLCISKTIYCVHEHQRYKWTVPNERMLWTDSIDITRRFFYRGAGESLHTIIIGDKMQEELRNGRNWVADFLQACPNLRSLSVIGNFELDALGFGRHLEKLEVVSNNPRVSIPSFCPSLLELNLFYESKFLNTVAYLPVSGINWQNVGSKLERLTLTGFSFPGDELTTMRVHCNNLKHIDIDSVRHENGKITEFIASYGNQLDFAFVYGMTESELNRVYGSCRNARFHAVVFDDQLLMTTLRTLGPRLVKLRIHSTADMDIGEWTPAWNLCSNLEMLFATQLRVGTIQAIMSIPKNHLKEIRIYYTGNVVCYGFDAETILNVIAEGTKNVEILYFCDYITSLAVFDKFIDKNKSVLRSFSINNRAIEAIPQSDVDKMVEKLLECPLLEVIDFEKVPAPGVSILKTLRLRGIHFRGLYAEY